MNTAHKNKISIAPMIDRTDRHYRFFMRQITQATLLYTEMITTSAILNGDQHHLLDFNETEQPLALQLGSDSPTALAECARIGQDYGYQEINLNVGCPSEKVKQGSFGACLMNSPELVARCVAAMKQAVDIPVTVKHRIGVIQKIADGMDVFCQGTGGAMLVGTTEGARAQGTGGARLASAMEGTGGASSVGITEGAGAQPLKNFVDTVGQAGCDKFIVHARIAILSGLSPKENRQIPPIDYEKVYQLKQDFPQYGIHINGEIDSLAKAQEHLEKVDGVMIGRAAYDNPWLFHEADVNFHNREGGGKPRDIRQVLENLQPYLAHLKEKGLPANYLIRHILGLFYGRPRARKYRRLLTENMIRDKFDYDCIKRLLESSMVE